MSQLINVELILMASLDSDSRDTDTGMACCMLCGIIYALHFISLSNVLYVKY